MATVYTLVQPMVAGTAYTFYAVVGSQSDTDVFQTSVTLEAGDWKLSKDGASFANLATLPTETDTSGLLTVSLSAAETTGITKFAIVKGSDAADDEWQDAVYMIPVSEAVTVSDFDESADSVTLTAAGIQAIFDATLTEGYAADGEAATLAQAIYEVMQSRNEMTVGAFNDSGQATVTIKKRDGSTTAFTFTVTSNSCTRAT